MVPPVPNPNPFLSQVHLPNHRSGRPAHGSSPSIFEINEFDLPVNAGWFGVLSNVCIHPTFCRAPKSKLPAALSNRVKNKPKRPRVRIAAQLLAARHRCGKLRVSPSVEFSRPRPIAHSDKRTPVGSWERLPSTASIPVCTRISGPNQSRGWRGAILAVKYLYSTKAGLTHTADLYLGSAARASQRPTRRTLSPPSGAVVAPRGPAKTIRQPAPIMPRRGVRREVAVPTQRWSSAERRAPGAGSLCPG